MTCKHGTKTDKTESWLNWHKAKCKERDQPSGDNEHDIPSNCTTASRKIEYPRLKTSNTISSNTIDIIYEKVLSGV